MSDLIILPLDPSLKSKPASISLEEHLELCKSNFENLVALSKSQDFRDHKIGIYYLYQTGIKNPFTACNGILIRDNDGYIIIDANLVEENVIKLSKILDMPLKYHIITHSHLDHACNLHHLLKTFHCKFFCPDIEDVMVISKKDHLKLAGFSGVGLDSDWLDFASSIGFEVLSEDSIIPIKNTETINFDFGYIRAIPLIGHSHNHLGFEIFHKVSNFKILYSSCLGVDYNENYKGFGPWYGFNYTYLSEYMNNIDYLQHEFNKDYHLMVGSHGGFVTDKSPYPFDYIREKINKNHSKVMNVVYEYAEIKAIDIINVNDINTYKDTIYRLDNITGSLLKLYKFWQFEFVKQHLIWDTIIGETIRVGRDEFKIKKN